MITRLKVDGFRSLSHFDMVIHPGLNILVGPNGSGKTNIVSFLQFLSYMNTYPLADAVTKAGGAGAVFQKIGSRQYRKGLTASIEGSYNYARERFVRPVVGGARRVLPSGIYPQIIRYLQTVNDTIVSLNVVNDPFDNRLKVGVGIIGEEGEIELPFSSMSDGTVKWASLITAILTYETIFAIEEPENFLHPLMQREILNIMRENVERRGGNSFVLMTTHSETLLNAADPSEVVVVSISNGITRTDRPSDTESLRKQIQRTGFGLGYFYISGALDDA
jgi:predicted ATPase